MVRPAQVRVRGADDGLEGREVIEQHAAQRSTRRAATRRRSAQTRRDVEERVQHALEARGRRPSGSAAAAPATRRPTSRAGYAEHATAGRGARGRPTARRAASRIARGGQVPRRARARTRSAAQADAPLEASPVTGRAPVLEQQPPLDAAGRPRRRSSTSHSRNYARTRVKGRAGTCAADRPGLGVVEVVGRVRGPEDPLVGRDPLAGEQAPPAVLGALAGGSGPGSPAPRGTQAGARWPSATRRSSSGESGCSTRRSIDRSRGPRRRGPPPPATSCCRAGRPADQRPVREGPALLLDEAHDGGDGQDVDDERVHAPPPLRPPAPRARPAGPGPRRARSSRGARRPRWAPATSGRAAPRSARRPRPAPQRPPAAAGEPCIRYGPSERRTWGSRKAQKRPST